MSFIYGKTIASRSAGRSRSRGLAGLRYELADLPREWTSWQVAMRSFPPKLRSFGNPGGIDLVNPAGSTNDKQALYSVPSMWTADPAYRDAGLWPVGDAGVIQRYVDRLLEEINQSLYGGRGLPRMEAVQAGTAQGQPVYAEIPVSGLDSATVAQLRAAAGQGTVALGRTVQQLVDSGQARTPASNATGSATAAQSELAGRAIQAAATASADVLAAATRGGQTNAQMANQILQGLSTGMLAVAPSIPFGIGYAVAGVLQIAAWAAGAWDHGAEPAEFAGYSYHWDTKHYRNVLYARVMIQTCADAAALQAIKGMSVEDASQAPGSCKQWLMRTSYGLDGGHNWTKTKSERAIMGGMQLARALGDPLEDAGMIDRIGTYLRYVGASDKAIEMTQHWLWDARRIERINFAITHGEVSPTSQGNPGVSAIGKYPDYWRDWAYRGLGMTPALYPRSSLKALHDSIRNRIVVSAPTATVSAAAMRAASMKLTLSPQQAAAAARQRQQAQSSAAATGTNLLPVLLVGGGGLLFLALLAKKR